MVKRSGITILILALALALALPASVLAEHDRWPQPEAQTQARYAPLRSVRVTPGKVKVAEGEVFTVTVKLSPRSGYRDLVYAWGPGLEEAGENTLNGSGTIRLRFRAVGAPQESYLKFYASGRRSKLLKTVKVNITSTPIRSIRLSASRLALPAGSTHQLKTELLPEDAGDRRLVWKSSNKKVATVDASGRITARRPGKATIECRAVEGGAKAKCVVTVQPVRVQSVRLSRATLSLAYKKSARLTATVLPANATDKRVTWKSSNKKVASVSASGKVTAGRRAGVAVITATTKDGRLVARCTVTVSKTGLPPAPSRAEVLQGCAAGQCD